MNSFQRKFAKIKRGISHYHPKKHHIEFVTALLSVPVLLTVIVLNTNSLKNLNKKVEPTPSPIVITQAPATQKEVIVTKEACKPGLGSVSIDNPDEGDSVNDNPVNVDVNYEANGYCNAVWSYRVNGGTWSNYDDSDVSLYNLPNGNIKFELRAKSVVNSDSKNLTRNFTYSGNSGTPTQTPSPTPNP